MSQRIILRADGNSAIGLGHLMRLLALYEILSNEFTCVFFTRADSDAKIKARVSRQAKLVEIQAGEKENDEVTEFLSCLDKNDIVVLDGYHFDSYYQQELKKRVKKLVMIDDLAEGHFFADVIINHGNASIATKYNAEKYTRILAGHEYLLVRKEFREIASTTYQFPGTGKLLISMGGADPLGITLKVIEAVNYVRSIKKIDIVIGSSFRYLQELKVMIHKLSPSGTINLFSDIEPSKIIELFRQCTWSVLPASTMALEACCVGTGLITGLTADNQRYLLEELERKECAVSLGDFRASTNDEIRNAFERFDSSEMINKIVANQKLSFIGASGSRILQEFKLLV